MVSPSPRLDLEYTLEGVSMESVKWWLDGFNYWWNGTLRRLNIRGFIIKRRGKLINNDNWWSEKSNRYSNIYQIFSINKAKLSSWQTDWLANSSPLFWKSKELLARVRKGSIEVNRYYPYLSITSVLEYIYFCQFHSTRLCSIELLLSKVEFRTLIIN